MWVSKLGGLFDTSVQTTSHGKTDCKIIQLRTGFLKPMSKCPVNSILSSHQKQHNADIYRIRFWGSMEKFSSSLRLRCVNGVNVIYLSVEKRVNNVSTSIRTHTPTQGARSKLGFVLEVTWAHSYSFYIRRACNNRERLGAGESENIRAEWTKSYYSASAFFSPAYAFFFLHSVFRSNF